MRQYAWRALCCSPCVLLTVIASVVGHGGSAGRSPAAAREVREKEVILCKPKRVVPVTRVTRILRHAIILASTLRDGGKDADEKKAALLAFFTSGVGRELLTSASDDIDKLRTLDSAHAKHTKKLLEDRVKVYTAQEQKFTDIFAAIDRIIRGEDDAEAVF